MAYRVFGLCLFCVCSLVTSQTPQPSCPKQLGRNAPSFPQSSLKGTEPQVCVSKKTCCTNQMEVTLKTNAVNDMKSRILKKYDGTKASLVALHADLKDYFEEIIQDAFVQNTQKWTETNRLPEAGRTALASFFSDMQDYLTDNKVSLKDVTKKFFKESFPILYQHSLAPRKGKLLTNSYAKCLKDKYDLVLPFGNHPNTMTARLSEALKPVQVFLESLQFGVRTIDQSKEFNFTSGCDKVLLQMSGCSLCKGYSGLKPCHRFCTDALKNCLSTESQLEKPWEEFIDALSGLATGMSYGSNMYSISNVMINLHQDMAQAFVYAVIHQTDVLTKTSKHCHQPQYLNAAPTNPGKGAVGPTPTPTSRIKMGLFPKMESAKQKLRYMRSIFLELVRSICTATSTAIADFDKCWNGKDKGRYTGLNKKPTDFQATSKDVQKLKGMVDVIHEKSKALKDITPMDNSDGEGSASGSSGGNKIPGSGNCVDDEDCGSAESGSKPTDQHGRNMVGDSTEIYFVTTPKPNHNVPAGGFDDTNLGARGGDATNTRQSTVLILTSLVFLLLL